MMPGFCPSTSMSQQPAGLLFFAFAEEEDDDKTWFGITMGIIIIKSRF